jgi:hypothetical protein
MLFDETGMVIRCMECDRPAHHEHHVIPASRGGTRTIPLCVECHGQVHDVEGWRTDTLKMLRAGKAGRDHRHRRVMRAFNERPGRLDGSADAGEATQGAGVQI